MCLNKNFFNLLLISFVFYISNSLEKRTESSGVLLTVYKTMETTTIVWTKVQSSQLDHFYTNKKSCVDC